MIALAVATELLYVLSALVLGGRLLVLFLFRGAPTGLLGVALVFGGAPVHALSLLVALAEVPPSRGAWQLAYAFLYVASGVAACCVMRFTTEVFRPRSRWLPTVNALVAGYYAVTASTVPFLGPVPRESPLALGALLVVGGIFVWASWEALVHWAMYRRAEGLDALVVDRFRLWGVAAIANVAVVALLFAAQGHPGLVGVAAGMGLISSVALWLAFQPPAAYARRVRRSAGAAHSPARP